MTGRPGACPDGGTCHHSPCDQGCFRVRCAGPLSGVYPDDRWPYDVVTANTPKPKNRIEGTWLVEEVDECTCGTPDSFSFGHEPGCGMIPLMDLSRLPGWDTSWKATP